MAKLAVFLVTVFGALFAGAASSQTIDLSDRSGLELLRTSRPQHYEVLQQILRGLVEHPWQSRGQLARAEFRGERHTTWAVAWD